MAPALKLGVLASGRGSNLQSIIDAIEAKRLDAELRIVISDKSDALALERAEKHGLPARFIDPKAFAGREEYDRELVRVFKEHQVELVALAGFMRIMTPLFIRSFPNRVLNIHPALLPAFPGLRVQRAAVRYAVKFSGATVHIVDEGVDTGPIVIQAVVSVLEGDSEEALAERILKEEHKIYPQAIQWFAQGRVKVADRRVVIEGASKPEGPTWFNPPLETK